MISTKLRNNKLLHAPRPPQDLSIASLALGEAPEGVYSYG